MTISELRNILSMSQRQFSNRSGIPIGTLRNWEQGISKPPEYVFQMLYAMIRRDKMINVETIKFMKMLDELAKHSLGGFESFEKATRDNFETKVFYDQTTLDEEGYRVVLDACLIEDPYHHDIISYYDSGSNEYKIRAVADENGEMFINIIFLLSEESISLEDGTWYFS